MEQTDSCRRGKEGEGISQRTCVNKTRTWTMERGLTVGERGSLSGGGKGKKVRTTIIE